MANLTFASVYPHYVNKVVRKGRTEEELRQIICWLTGLDQVNLQAQIDAQTNFATFFEQAHLPPNAALIKGVICGIRVENIENPLSQKIRYLDKIVDELAKGKSLEKIMR